MNNIVPEDDLPEQYKTTSGMAVPEDDLPSPARGSFLAEASKKAGTFADQQLEKARGADGQPSLIEGAGLTLGIGASLPFYGITGGLELASKVGTAIGAKGREIFKGEAPRSWESIRQQEHTPSKVASWVKDKLPDSISAGIDLPAAPFIGGFEQVAEDFGHGWALLAEASLAAIGMRGAHKALQPNIPKKPTTVPEYDLSTPNEAAATVKKGTPTNQLEMELPQTDAGKYGLGGRQLQVDENGMPIDLERSMEMQKTTRDAVNQPDLFAGLEAEARRTLVEKYDTPDADFPAKTREEILAKDEKDAAWQTHERNNRVWRKVSEEEAWRNHETSDPSKSLDKYAGINLGELLIEESKRATVVSERMVKDASAWEQRALPQESVTNHLTALREQALSEKAPDLTTEGKTAYDKTVSLVSTVLPRLFSKAADIFPVNMRILKDAQVEFYMLEQLYGKDMANAKFLERNQQYLSLFKKHPEAAEFIRSIKFNEEYLPPAIAKRTEVGGKSHTTVLMDTARLNQFAKNPAKIASMLVHELIHAKQFSTEAGLNKIRKETAYQLKHSERPSELAATRGEETAAVKFGELFRKKGFEDGAPKAAAIYPKGSPYRSPSSVRAENPALRTQGALGPGRRQSGHYNPEVLFGPMLRAGEKMVVGMRAWWNKDSPPQKFDEAVKNTPDMNTTDLINSLGKLDEDIKNTPGFRTSSYAGENVLIGGDPARHKSRMVAAHFLKKTVERLHSEHAANYDPLQIVAKLETFYGVGEKWMGGVLPRLTPRKTITLDKAREFAKDTKIALWFEKNPNQWFDKASGKWYPDEAQLVDKGMSPEAAAHWKSVFDVVEASWSTLEKALGENQKHLVKRVPGYLPHVFSGPYRAIAYIPAHGKVPDKFIAEFGAHSRKEMNANLALMKQHIKDAGVVFKPEEPQPGKQDVAVILDGLRRARDAVESSPRLANLAKLIEENAAKSVISYALDRGSPTRFGHSLERAANYGADLGFSDRKNMTESVEVFRDYIKAVNGYAERAKLVNETLIPLDAAGFLDAPNLNRFVMDYFKSYVKIPEQSGFDVFWKSRLAGMGLDPAIYAKSLQMTQKYAANWYLLLNTPFYFVNSVQATASLPIMFAKQAQARLNGEKVPSVNTALRKATARMHHTFTEDGVIKDPELLWAQKRGLLDPQATDIADPGAFYDPISRGLDQKTRRIAFLYGYEFWRQTMPREKALVRAGEFANEVSVPYSSQVGAPAILNKLGHVGKASGMFVTYSSHIFGMFEQNVRLMRAAAKTGNPVAATKALAASVTFAGMQMAMFGAAAMPMFMGINNAIGMINDFFGEDVLPTVEEVARKAEEATGLKGQIEFGLAGTATGMDFTGAASGVTLQAPTAFPRFLGTAFEAAMLLKPFLKGNTPTQQAVHEFTKSIPPGPKMAVDLVQRITGISPRDYPNTTVQRSAHEAGRERTQAEQFLALMGTRSIKEKSEQTTDRMVQLTEARIANRIKTLDEKLKSQGMTVANAEKLLELAEEYDKDPATVIRAYENHLTTSGLDPEIRRALRVKSLDEAGRYLRRQNTQSTEHMRR